MVAGKRVLVAEDSAAMARVLRRNLEDAGLEVVMAADGHQAWQILGTQPVDIVVTDYAMPFVDGGKLCGKMRSDDRFVDTPIILLTGRGFEIDIERLRNEMHLAEVFYKPFSAAELIRCVVRCAERLCQDEAAQASGSAT